MNETMKPVHRRNVLRRHGGAFILIMTVAFIIRLWGIDNGLPHVQRPDESGDIAQSLQFVQGDTPQYAYHRVAWPLLQLPVHGAHFALNALTHTGYSIADFEASYYTDRHTFILSTRLYLAFITSLSCLAVYALLINITPRFVAVGGGLLLAVYPPYAYLSHIALPDAFAGAVVAFCLLGVAWMVARGSRWAYAFAGAMAALALLARLQTVILVIVPVALAHVVIWWQQPEKSWRFLFTYWLWAFAGFIGAHLILNPFIILNPQSVINDLQFIFNERYTGSNNWQQVSYSPLENIQNNLALPIIFLRPYLMVVFVGATLYSLVRHQITMVVIAVAGWLFLLSLLPTTTPRITFWLQTAIPISIVCAWALGDWVIQKTGWQRGIGVGIALIIGVWASVETIQINHILAQPDTQSLAYDAFTAIIPPDARVMIGDTFIYTVPLQRNITSLQRVEAMGWTTSSQTFFLDNPALLPDAVYDIYGSEYISQLQSDEAMQAFIADNAIEYIVVVDYCEGDIPYHLTSALNFPKITPAIVKDLTLITTFSPFIDDTCYQAIQNRTHMEYMQLHDWQRVGPILRLYAVAPLP